MINTSGENNEFYRRTLEIVSQAKIPFLVGGAFAMDFFLGTSRRTKDLDIFVKPEDVDRVLEILAQAGYRTGIHDPLWIGKAYCGDDFVDVIFGFGNGSTKIDTSWFPPAPTGQLWGVTVQFCPLEEALWSKAFVAERDRYDGADIAHIILFKGPELDWDRIVARFGPHWRVLLSHLVLFGFIYPGERDRVPARIMRQLLNRLQGEMGASEEAQRCFGPFLSRTQYVYDLEQLGMADAREGTSSNAGTA